MTKREKQLKKYRQKPVIGKKRERQLKRLMQSIRRKQRRANEDQRRQHDLWIENELEMQRIIREVDQEG